MNILDHPLSTKVSLSCCMLLYCKKQPATATCESETDALTDPKIVLHFMETTDVPQSEKTSLLFPHSKEATPINANPDAEGIYITRT